MRKGFYGLADWPPLRCGSDFASIVFKLILRIDILSTSYEISLRGGGWMRDVVRTPKYMRRNSCEHYLIWSDLHLHWDLKYRPFNSSVEMYVYEGDFICLFCKETSVHHGFKFNIFSILRLQHCVIFERLCMWCETFIYIIAPVRGFWSWFGGVCSLTYCNGNFRVTVVSEPFNVIL